MRWPQPPRSWRGVQDWATVVTAALLLSGCAAGFSAQTLQPYQPGEGISSRSGQVYAINTLVVTDGKGNGTVVAALINQKSKQDALMSVAATDTRGSTLKVQALPRGGISLPYGQSVQLADSGAVRISGTGLEAGMFITLTFAFSQAAPVKIMVPVVNRGSIYAKVPIGSTGRGSPPIPSATQPTTP